MKHNHQKNNGTVMASATQIGSPEKNVITKNNGETMPAYRNVTNLQWPK